MTTFVRDAYASGAGVFRAAAFGVVRLAELRGAPELAHGELMRYLAEAPWYPTALLPGQGVRWEPIDDVSARASLTDGATTVAGVPLRLAVPQHGAEIPTHRPKQGLHAPRVVSRPAGRPPRHRGAPRIMSA